jgi:hypothetical protein
MRCEYCPAYWEDCTPEVGVEDWGCYLGDIEELSREFKDGSYSCNRKRDYIKRKVEKMDEANENALKLSNYNWMEKKNIELSVRVFELEKQIKEMISDVRENRDICLNYSQEVVQMKLTTMLNQWGQKYKPKEEMEL